MFFFDFYRHKYLNAYILSSSNLIQILPNSKKTTLCCWYIHNFVSNVKNYVLNSHLTSGNYLIKANQTPNQGSGSLVSHIPQRNTTNLMKKNGN